MMRGLGTLRGRLNEALIIRCGKSCCTMRSQVYLYHKNRKKDPTIRSARAGDTLWEVPQALDTLSGILVGKETKTVCDGAPFSLP